jgi:hypothetical protein
MAERRDFGPCVCCGEIWRVTLADRRRRRGFAPSYCQRCRTMRKHLGQLERLVNERPWSSRSSRARDELRSRINAVRNRIRNDRWRGQRRGHDGRFRAAEE